MVTATLSPESILMTHENQVDFRWRNVLTKWLHLNPPPNQSSDINTFSPTFDRMESDKKSTTRSRRVTLKARYEDGNLSDSSLPPPSQQPRLPPRSSSLHIPRTKTRRRSASVETLQETKRTVHFLPLIQEDKQLNEDIKENVTCTEARVEPTAEEKRCCHYSIAELGKMANFAKRINSKRSRYYDQPEGTILEQGYLWLPTTTPFISHKRYYCLLTKSQGLLCYSSAKNAQQGKKAKMIYKFSNIENCFHMAPKRRIAVFGANRPDKFNQLLLGTRILDKDKKLSKQASAKNNTTNNSTTDSNGRINRKDRERMVIMLAESRRSKRQWLRAICQAIKMDQGEEISSDFEDEDNQEEIDQDDENTQVLYDVVSLKEISLEIMENICTEEMHEN